MLFNTFQDILFATANEGKLKECSLFFHETECRWHGLQEYPSYHVEEDGRTFNENAYKKAIAGYKVSKLPTLAEDSGIVVPALNGEPGIRSARYGGENLSTEERNNYLIEQLKKRGIPERTPACYHTSLLFAADEETLYLATGRLNGEILFTPRGEHGFGYDPIFFIPSLNRSAAQLSSSEKNRISHRGEAMRKYLRNEMQKIAPSAIMV